MRGLRRARGFLRSPSWRCIWSWHADMLFPVWYPTIKSRKPGVRLQPIVWMQMTESPRGVLLPVHSGYIAFSHKPIFTMASELSSPISSPASLSFSYSSRTGLLVSLLFFGHTWFLPQSLYTGSSFRMKALKTDIHSTNSLSPSCLLSLSLSLFLPLQ